MMHSRKSILRDFQRQNTTQFLAAVLSGTLSSAINILIPLSIGHFFVLQFHEQSAKGNLLRNLGFEPATVQQYFLLLAILIVLRFASGTASKIITRKIANRFVSEIRYKLFAHQLHQPASAFEKDELANHLNRYTGEMSPVRNYISKVRIEFVADIIFMLLFFIILIQYESILAGIVFGGLIAGISITLLLSRLAVKTDGTRKRHKSNLLQFVTSRMQGFLSVKSFNRETPEINQFSKLSSKLELSENRSALFKSVEENLIPLVFFTIIGTILYVVSSNNGQYDTAALLSFILLVLYMQRVFRRMLQVPGTLSTGRQAVDKLVLLLNSPTEQRNPQQERLKTGKLTINNLTFFGHSGVAIGPLSHIFFQGSITRIVCNDREQVSRFFRVLMAHDAPTSGKLSIDGHDYHDLHPFGVRKNVSIVGVEYPLLGNSIIQAVSYSQPNENMEEALNLIRRIHGPESPLLLVDPTTTSPESRSEEERIILQIVRAQLTKKKVQILFDPFNILPIESRNQLVTFLNESRSKCTYLIFSAQWPESLHPDHEYTLPVR
jgi:ABC-type multidrug transport system fused ATPase/permease subunit